jgi:hypothetical protein
MVMEGFPKVVVLSERWPLCAHGDPPSPSRDALSQWPAF